jgi:PKD repeat protein
MTFGYKIKSWWWDFGDGTFSDVQDPTHIFPAPGIYFVSLTVSSYPSSYEYYKTSTIVKQVQVAPTVFYDLGGHVFTGLYPPVDMGFAYLYMITGDEQFIPVDTAVIDPELGYYYFHSLIEGKYTTKARLYEESAYYGQYIPTYLGNTLAWEESGKVTLDQTNWECDINLIHSAGFPNGSGSIMGQMLYDTSQVNNPLMPAGDVEVVLLGVEGAHITCKVSDLQGDFQFNNLAYGTYQLYPDVAGVPTPPMFITLSENKPVADDFSLVISEEEVTYLAIGEPESPVSNVSSIYPNPAHDQLKVSIGMKKQADITVMIVDAAGRCVQSFGQTLREGNTDLNVDVSQLRSGFYQVVIVSGASPAYTGKFLKTN